MLVQSGDALLLLLNGGARSKPFTLPALGRQGVWTEIINTSHPGPAVKREGHVTLGARSLLLLRYQPL
jgi:hypothetical protein